MILELNTNSTIAEDDSYDFSVMDTEIDEFESSAANARKRKVVHFNFVNSINNKYRLQCYLRRITT